MLSLPILADFEAFRAWRADASKWLPVALDIARGHGLSTASPRIFATGTNLVLALDDRLILKIFPPIHRNQFVSERGSLSRLHGRLSVPIPEIVCEGERDRWPYLAITRLPGVSGAEAWPSLPEDQKERLLAQIGAAIGREFSYQLLAAVAQGSPRLFLGSDSAPHARSAKENACGCAGIFSAHAALELYAEAFESANALDKHPAGFPGQVQWDR